MKKRKLVLLVSIILVAMSCKIDPQPAPVSGMELVFKRKLWRIYCGMQNPQGINVIPVEYDSIRAGYDRRFVIASKQGDDFIYFQPAEQQNYLWSGKLLLSGDCGEHGPYYLTENEGQKGFLFVRERPQTEEEDLLSGLHGIFICHKTTGKVGYVRQDSAYDRTQLLEPVYDRVMEISHDEENPGWLYAVCGDKITKIKLDGNSDWRLPQNIYEEASELPLLADLKLSLSPTEQNLPRRQRCGLAKASVVYWKL